jgi:hypothetical protein
MTGGERIDADREIDQALPSRGAQRESACERRVRHARDQAQPRDQSKEQPGTERPEGDQLEIAAIGKGNQGVAVGPPS